MSDKVHAQRQSRAKRAVMTGALARRRGVVTKRGKAIECDQRSSRLPRA